MRKARLLLEIEYNDDDFGGPIVSEKGLARALYIMENKGESVKIIYLHYEDAKTVTVMPGDNGAEDIISIDPASDAMELFDKPDVEFLLPPNCCDGCGEDLKFSTKPYTVGEPRDE